MAKIMGFDIEAVEELMHKYAFGYTVVKFELFLKIFEDLVAQFKVQDGRYYVLLSLEEAEHVRAVMHARTGIKSSLLSSEVTSVAQGSFTTANIWTLNDNEMSSLGASYGYSSSYFAQHNSMVNSYRYLNSDVYFDDKGITVLLRILAGNSCDEREKWWTDVRACRRRRQIACDGTMPVSTVFSTATEFQFMEFKAVVDRVQLALQERGMLVFDAFRAFNSSNTGLMTCSELYGGLDYLGIPFTPDQVYDLVRKLSVLNEVNCL
jgi:hypothetical protein